MAFKVKNALTLNTMLALVVGEGEDRARVRAVPRPARMTMPPSQLGAFVKSDPSQATPNLEFHVQPISLDRFGEPPHPFPAFTASVCNLRPTSRGHVRISLARSARAIRRSRPTTSPRTRTARSRSTRSASTRRIVTGTEAMKKYEPEEFMPGPAFQSDDELRRGGGQHRHHDFPPGRHVQDGARQRPAAVVDPQLRVRGIERLRVIDASIMPTITSGNTNSPTVMIAERAAGIVMAEK